MPLSLEGVKSKERYCPWAVQAGIESKSKAWFAGVLGAERAKALSIHSGRVTLASALGVKQQPTSRIKELCRWKADTSVAGYKRLTPVEYAVAVRDATRVCAATLPPAQRTIVDDDGAFRDLEAMRLALDSGEDENDARRGAARDAAGPETQGRASPRQVASTGNAGPRMRGKRINMLWGDEWFAGTCGANRRDGECWATRVLFDAVDGRWPAAASLHVLAEEEYEDLAGAESGAREGRLRQRRA